MQKANADPARPAFVSTYSSSVPGGKDSPLATATFNRPWSNNPLRLITLGTEQPVPDFTKLSAGDIVGEAGSYHGLAWGDYDKDNHVDLFVTTLGQKNRLFHNNGDGTFTRVTTGDIVNDVGSSTGCAWGDYDNDGYLDLFVSNSNGENNFLYHNNGDGTFTKILSGAIVSDGGLSFGCAWGDYDNDGFIDPYVANLNGRNFLYHNNRDGTFSKITSGDPVNNLVASVGCAWGDYDNDGFLDLFVASGGGQKNFLFHNQGDGKFTRITTGSIVNDSGYSVSAAWGDFDNDGYLDLAVANRLGNNLLYRNNRDGTFTKITTGSIVTDGGESNSVAWGDYDNDGWLDLFVTNWQGQRNFLYRNNGDGTFAKITSGNIVNEAGNSVASGWADYNGDGALDLFVVNLDGQNSLFRNQSNGNNWIAIKCDGTKSNKAGIGAKVKITARIGGTAHSQMRQITAGDGWSSQELSAHFGLGVTVTVDTIRIEWPSGAVQELQNVAAKQVLTVTEPGGPPPIPDQDFTKVTAGDIITDGGNSQALAWGDYDNDGFVDLFVSHLSSPNFLYHNNGNGTFTKVTTGDIVTQGGVSVNAAWGDYDNDGFLDLFVASRGQPNFLFHNDGNGTFTKITHGELVTTVAQSWGCAWADYDRDGYLDLFVCSEQKNFLYHNNGDGTFARVTSGSIANDNPGGTGAAWGDYDNDGYPDLFVAVGSGLNNVLYHNNSDGTFTKITAGSIVNERAYSVSTAWGDFDNDAWLDLFVANRLGPNFLYRNNRDGSFTKITAGNITNEVGESNGCSWGDFDNDGNLDLFVANWQGHKNFLYRNLGDGTFKKITTGSIAEGGGNSVACGWADINNDGALDLFVANLGGEPNYLYRNEGNQNNWIAIKCVGKASNRFGVGAKIKIIAGPWQVRQIGGGDGWNSQNLTASFGVSTAKPVHLVLVEWPSGASQQFAGLPVNQILTVTEPLQTGPALTITPKGGTFTDSVTVALTTTIPNGVMYYLLEDGVPPFNTSVYSSPITLTSTTVLKAWVYANGVIVSTVAQALYFKTGTGFPPTILTQPQNQNAMVGNDVNIGVIASASEPLVYQWKFNGADITGANSPTLVLNQVKTSNAGTYTVVVSNNAGGVTSEGVVLNVSDGQEGGTLTFANRSISNVDAPVFDVDGVTKLAGPSFLAQLFAGLAPDNLVAVGAAVPFRTGVGAGYWQPVNRTIPFVTPGNPASVQVRVWASVDGPTFEAAVSNRGKYGASKILNLQRTGGARDPVTGNLGAPEPMREIESFALSQGMPGAVAPSITTPLQHQTVTEGASASFTVVATGTEPLSYRWRFNGSDITGATTATLVLNQVQTSNAGTYTVVVSNSAGSVTSEAVVLNVSDGQGGGTIAFGNRSSPDRIDAPVFDVDGVTKLSGADFLAQLYAGAAPEAMVPIGGAVPFRTGAASGYWTTVTRTIPFLNPGARAYLQVRAWASADGPTYEAAVAAHGKYNAAPTLSLVLGCPLGQEFVIPCFPMALEGLVSFSLTQGPPDEVAPIVFITSPAAGTTDNENITLTGTATDNIGASVVTWERDGNLIGSLTLNNGQFTVPSLRLHKGDNHLRVVARDSRGNQSAAEVVIAYAPSRILAVVDPADQQEGATIKVPLQLTSQGDVGGMSFVLRYDTSYLREPELNWTSVGDGSFKDVNYGTPGEVRASFALPATAVPAGVRVIAEVSFRARSVPNDLTTDLTLDLLDVSLPTGSSVNYGNDARSGKVRILERKIVGDNNANDRLDVGDATVILRYVTSQELPRSWDVPGNDLNQNNGLDSGDVIKVLRTVVELDPQPQPAGWSGVSGRIGKAGVRKSDETTSQISTALASTTLTGFVDTSAIWAFGSASVPEQAVLAASKTRGSAGELITVQVNLQNLRTKLSGASFTLDYPTNALRLLNSQSHRIGAIVPASAVAVWNVAPAQNDFTTQAGRVSAAMSSGTPWTDTNGAMAVFTFQVQAGAVENYRWSISLSSLEVTADGFKVRSLPASVMYFIGRDPWSASLNAALQFNEAGPRLTLVGEREVRYLIESSADLIEWKPLVTLFSVSGTLEFADPDGRDSSYRFYRAKRLD